MIRRRYTVLDLAAETGLLGELVDELFAPGGSWAGEGRPVTAGRGRPAADRLYGAYLFDLDGTIYLGDELLPGAERLVRPCGSGTCRSGSCPTTRPRTPSSTRPGWTASACRPRSPRSSTPSSP